MPAEPDAVPETFVFACGDCGHAWERTFRVMFFTDPGRPDIQDYVDENGKALASPLAAAVCPRCGSRTVQVTSPEVAARAVERPHRERHLSLPHLPHRRRHG